MTSFEATVSATRTMDGSPTLMIIWSRMVIDETSSDMQFDPLPFPWSRQPFRMLSLPQELVDKIYHYMLQDNNLNILLTCRLVNEQATKILYKFATLKIPIINGHGPDFEIKVPRFNLHMRGEVPRFIQNLEIHCFPTMEPTPGRTRNDPPFRKP